jgi:hypothetical protein
MFISICMIRSPKKSKFGQVRNRSSNLGQRLLLKVSSNLGQREYLLMPCMHDTFFVLGHTWNTLNMNEYMYACLASTNQVPSIFMSNSTSSNNLSNELLHESPSGHENCELTVLQHHNSRILNVRTPQQELHRDEKISRSLRIMRSLQIS